MSMKLFQVGVKGVIQDPRGILLIKTNEERGSRWEFPGGRIDGNETIEDTVRREISEELPGAELTSVVRTLGTCRIQKDIFDDVSLVLIFLQIEASIPENITLSEEHESYLWVNKPEDIPKGLNPGIDKILRNLLTE